MLYLGIDPGVSGGLAALRADGGVQGVAKMPETDGDVLAWLAHLQKVHGCYAVLERVSASPQMGVVSAFTFGRGYGALQMALHAAGIPYDLITPGTWQRALRCLSRGDKSVTKARAQALFPGLRVTHAIADALLIAEYARRFQRGLAVAPERTQRHGKTGRPAKAEAENQDRALENRAEAERNEWARDEAAHATTTSPARHGAASRRAPRGPRA